MTTPRKPRRAKSSAASTPISTTSAASVAASTLNLTSAISMPGDCRPLVYTVKEAAAILRVCEATCWTMIRTGELRSIKVRGRRLVPASAVEALVAGIASTARQMEG